MHPHVAVAANGFPNRGEILPIVLLKGVARSREVVQQGSSRHWHLIMNIPLARDHNIRPDVIYVPMLVHTVGRRITMSNPRDPPLEPVA